MITRPTCSHPVIRRGRLASCTRAATVRVLERGKTARPLCRYHASHGRFRPLAWDALESVETAGLCDTCGRPMDGSASHSVSGCIPYVDRCDP